MASEPSNPITQASESPFLSSSKYEFFSSKDPGICAPPIPPWDSASESPPSPPRDAVSASSRASGPQGGGTHGSGADPGTGGLPPAPAPAAGSGGRGGAGAGNRLDDVTPAGGRRVPEGRESRGRLEHLGTCSPGGAVRSLRRSHWESPKVHFTDRKNEVRKPRAT